MKDFQAYLYYKYRNLYMETSRHGRCAGSRKSTWESRADAKKKHLVRLPSTLLQNVEILNRSDRAVFCRVLSTCAGHNAAGSDELREINDYHQVIENAFAEALSLGKAARTPAAQLFSLMTALGVMVACGCMPFTLAPTWQYCTWAPTYLTAAAFSYLIKLSQWAEAPYGNDAADIDLFDSMVRTVREVKGVQRVALGIRDRMLIAPGQLSSIYLQRDSSRFAQLGNCSSFCSSSGRCSELNNDE